MTAMDWIESYFYAPTSYVPSTRATAPDGKHRPTPLDVELIAS